MVITDVKCVIKINELKTKSTYIEDDAYKGLQEAFTYKYYQSSHLGLRDSPHAK